MLDRMVVMHILFSLGEFTSCGKLRLHPNQVCIVLQRDCVNIDISNSLEAFVAFGVGTVNWFTVPQAACALSPRSMFILS